MTAGAQSTYERRLRALLGGVAPLALALALAGPLAAEPPGAAAPAADPPAKRLSVSVEDGLLSVDVGEVELVDVLRAISEQTGIRLHVRGATGPVQPQAFEGLPLPQALWRLVGRSGTLMILRPDPDHAGVGTPQTVRIYASDHGGSATQTVAFVPPPEAKPPAPRTDPGERLAEVRELASEEELIAVLRDEPEASVRRAAVGALAEFGSGAALEGIILALKDSDRSVRLKAIETVATLSDESSLARIEQALAGLTDARTRTAVIRALQEAEENGDSWSTL